MLQHGACSGPDQAHRRMNTHEPSHEAFYPLTLPLTVCPGSISVAITLGANAPHGYAAKLAAVTGALFGSALIGVSVYLCYRFADRLALVLGPTGMNVFVRLSSFLLLCIGVQILWNGLSALIAGLSPFAHK